jgi:hypothetical protein
MRYEDIGDPIEVITLFRDGALKPLKFRWKGRVYRISRVNGGWCSDEGATKFHHFSVMSDGPDVYELAYNSSDLNWELSRVCLVG